MFIWWSRQEVIIAVAAVTAVVGQVLVAVVAATTKNSRC